ncbi:MAG: hypothetical protein DMF49_08010 [Acidobacteria bacterium]|nr:MAG: hypothetical protein DMF49_08010 [Acidobacteriota bacterium]
MRRKGSDPALRGPRRAPGPILILFVVLLAPAGCAGSKLFRQESAPSQASGQSAAARYRGWVRAGERQVPFRAQIFAAKPDKLRVDVLSPLGPPRLSVVFREGKALAVIPRERSFWSGASGTEGGKQLGLGAGEEFWVLAMLGDREALAGFSGVTTSADSRKGEGEIELSRRDADGSLLRLHYDEKGTPPLLVESETARGGTRVSVHLERLGLLDLPEAKAFEQAIPEGFAALPGFNLLDLIASGGEEES